MITGQQDYLLPIRLFERLFDASSNLSTVGFLARPAGEAEGGSVNRFYFLLIGADERRMAGPGTCDERQLYFPPATTRFPVLG
jgi:hypothetical protein